jgi:hypothetical protein
MACHVDHSAETIRLANQVLVVDACVVPLIASGIFPNGSSGSWHMDSNE